MAPDSNDFKNKGNSRGGFDRYRSQCREHGVDAGAPIPVGDCWRLALELLDSLVWALVVWARLPGACPRTSKRVWDQAGGRLSNCGQSSPIWCQGALEPTKM